MVILKMNFSDLLKEAFRSITANKLRSGLTILGIVIGITAVIAMLSIGEGAKRQIAQSIESLGSNMLTVFPGIIQPGRGIVSAGRGTAQSLKMKDVEVIKKIEGVKAVSPEISRRFQIVSSSGKNTNSLVLGVTPDYLTVRNAKIQSGKFFKENDLNRVAVLGPTVAEDLFGGEDPIGKTIKINKVNFKVIGVLEPKGSAGFINPDEVVLVPLLVMQKILTGSEYLSQIAVQAESSDLIESLKEEITQVLLKEHKVSPDNPDFSVIASQEFLNAFNSLINTMTIFLASIAAISLVVGGIGIMNMMLTSVTERTKEIGLRKAIGAKKKEILMQFLIESVILTLIGGIFGIILGSLISIGVSKFANITSQVSLYSIFLSLTFSSLVGIIFGYWPAKKAAELDPIVALRYE
jgi:putative ABC transport system permease protein